MAGAVCAIVVLGAGAAAPRTAGYDRAVPSDSSTADLTGNSLFAAFVPLLPLTMAVFIGYFAMGMAMPVVPLHVHSTLGFSTVVVGVVMGSQFASSFFARLWAGSVADARGGRYAAMAGLLGASGVGCTYLVSVAFLDRPTVSVGILVAARLMTGVAESFIITALLSWGIARMGAQHAGKVIGWIGMFLFAAYAAGPPVGAAVHARFGFAGIAVATIVIPLVALVLVWSLHGVAPSTEKRLPFYRVLGAVKLPGLGLTLCSVGYAMITAFIALLFAQRGWGGAALAFTSMGAGFIVARLPFGHLPDKVGGAQVAVWTVLLAALGQVLIWMAPGPVLACVGAAFTGGGYALAFQGFGVEAVKRTPPQSRGAAMGAYVAFQDVAMGLAPPAGGVLASVAGLESVYLAAAVLGVGAAVVAALMLKSGSSGSPPARG
jgi:MFS family permease